MVCINELIQLVKCMVINMARYCGFCDEIIPDHVTAHICSRGPFAPPGLKELKQGLSEEELKAINDWVNVTVEDTLENHITPEDCPFCNEGKTYLAKDECGLLYRFCENCKSEIAGTWETKYNKEFVRKIKNGHS
jgi:hypothetical protein